MPRTQQSGAPSTHRPSKIPRAETSDRKIKEIVYLDSSDCEVEEVEYRTSTGKRYTVITIDDYQGGSGNKKRPRRGNPKVASGSTSEIRPPKKVGVIEGGRSKSDNRDRTEGDEENPVTRDTERDDKKAVIRETEEVRLVREEYEGKIAGMEVENEEKLKALVEEQGKMMKTMEEENERKLKALAEEQERTMKVMKEEIERKEVQLADEYCDMVNEREAKLREMRDDYESREVGLTSRNDREKRELQETHNRVLEGLLIDNEQEMKKLIERNEVKISTTRTACWKRIMELLARSEDIDEEDEGSVVDLSRGRRNVMDWLETLNT